MADGRQRPGQRLPDAWNVVGLCADQQRCDFPGQFIQGGAARAQGVAEPQPLVSRLGLQPDEDQRDVGQRALPAGQDLGVAGGVGQRQAQQGYLGRADGVRVRRYPCGRRMGSNRCWTGAVAGCDGCRGCCRVLCMRTCRIMAAEGFWVAVDAGGACLSGHHISAGMMGQ